MQQAAPARLITDRDELGRGFPSHYPTVKPRQIPRLLAYESQTHRPAAYRPGRWGPEFRSGHRRAAQCFAQPALVGRRPCRRRRICGRWTGCLRSWALKSVLAARRRCRLAIGLRRPYWRGRQSSPATQKSGTTAHRGRSGVNWSCEPARLSTKLLLIL